MNYFKRHWDESTGEELTDSWGTSTYYLETDDEGYVTRQLVIFENGNVLKYDEGYLDDKLGGLAEGSLDLEEFNAYRIGANEFERSWSSSVYKKFPEIVCTADVLWGQPRLEGRRLAVGDIVSHVDVNESAILAVEDYEISLQEVRQALNYCSDRQCVNDKVLRYCHNCSLRVQQDGAGDGEEQDNWVRAARLLKKYFNL